MYREQYDRMMRWYDRFAAIDAGRVHDRASDNYLDEIYAFFMNCYHLKDWIINDGSIPALTSHIVESYINGSRPLQLCGDICNSLKHLSLRTDKKVPGKIGRSGEAPSFGKKLFKLGLGGGNPPTISLEYEVNTSNGAEDAFKLATDCVTAWDDFMKKHGL
jgi:hypothetical protein